MKSIDLKFIDDTRKEKNIRRMEMARYAGISPRYYRDIINGNSNASFYIIEKLVECLGYKLIITPDI